MSPLHYNSLIVSLITGYLLLLLSHVDLCYLNELGQITSQKDKNCMIVQFLNCIL